jgi:hypothetical protein
MSNDNKDLPTRLQEAIEWLQEHQEESITTASRIFQLNRTTLAYSIQKAKHVQKGGQNRILTPSQERAIHQFIESYLDHGLLPTKGVLQAVVTRLRQLENKGPPSNSWFQKWWKTQPLHKIKTKPIAKDRITAQAKGEVVAWFQRYREVLKTHNIQRKDIWNFDETGFRIGCPKGQEIYVPNEVKEVSYSIILYSTLIYINYILVLFLEP